MSEPKPVVLLVEDDPDVAAYTGTVLRHLAGARVLDAASADAALAALSAHDVDLVVTDIELLGRAGAAPGADGLALTGEIRRRHPLLPVVVLSGHATFDHAVVAMRAGASELRVAVDQPDGHPLHAEQPLREPGDPVDALLAPRRRDPEVLQRPQACGLAGRLEDHGGGHPSNGTARPPDRPRSPPGREPPAE